MENDQQSAKCKPKSWCGGQGAGAGVYGLGFIGAAVYFIQQSATFWDGVVGVLKAIVWPALVVYRVLGVLGM
jgi:hypothetical protein